jgi:hypothetical protein
VPILNTCKKVYYNGAAVLKIYAGSTLVFSNVLPITDFTFSRIAGDNLSEFRWAGVSGNFPNVKIAPVSSAAGIPYDFAQIGLYSFSAGFFSLQMKFSNYGYVVGDTFNATVTNFTDSTQSEKVAQSTFLCTIDPL